MRPLDLGKEDRLLTDIRVQKEICAGEKPGDAIKPSECEECPFQQRMEIPLELQRGNRWKGFRNECADGFAPHAGGLILSRLASSHGGSPYSREFNCPDHYLNLAA